jgi:peptidoglycan/xylan/chitin deacetylase (PgdA/CDA1 family)
MDAILTLHSIDDTGSMLSYAPGELEALLDGLAMKGVRIVPLAEILAPTDAPGHRVVLTFDDGIRSVHRMALPILARRRLPATLYVVAGWVGRTNAWPSQPAGMPSFPLMSWDELREARDAGLGIGSHTASHRYLRALGEQDWQGELADARARLEDELQVAVEDFAYPYGTYDDEAVARVRAVHRSAVTTDLGFTTGAPLHRLRRIDTYYLRPARARLPLFAGRTRRYLALRAALRRARRAVMR